MKRIFWGAPLGVLLLVSALYFTQYIYVNASATNQVQNSCAEGQYLDLDSDMCRSLVKNFGFDADAFQQNFSNREYTVTSCDESAIREQFNDIDSSGGTVMLPACTITVKNGLVLPSNTIVQGAGVGRTIFKAASGFTGNVIKAKYEENVIIRDLSVDGGNVAGGGILLWYSDNALVERVDVYASQKSGIIFRYSQRITIRYSESHHHKTYHGIDSKDCFPKSSTPDSQECADQAGPVAPGVLYSTNYAIYSNKLHSNGRYGLDSHASNGEVAGNQINNNDYGSKFPDASYVWIHHNNFSDNDHWGSWVYNTLDTSAQTASKIVFFENHFANNNGYPVDVDNPARDIYLISNTYHANQQNRLSITDASVYVCTGTQDATIGAVGTSNPRTASAAQCDLAKVAHLFGQDDQAPVPVATSQPTIAPTTAPVATSTSTPKATIAATTTAMPTSTAVPTATPTPSANTTNSRVTLPGRLEAESYKSGGAGVGFQDSTSGNAGGALRTDSVDIEPITDDGSGYNIGWIEAGEWLAYDVYVESGGIYKIDARVNTWGSEQRKLHIEVDGTDITGDITFDGSVGHRVWTTATADKVELPAGNHTFRIVMDTAGFNLNYVDFTLVASNNDVVTPQPTPVIIDDETRNNESQQIFLPVING